MRRKSMKKFLLFLIVALWGLGGVLAQNLPQHKSFYAYKKAISDSVTKYNLRTDSSLIKTSCRSISGLHKWFLTREMELAQEHQEKSLKLKGIYSYWDWGKKLYLGHWYTGLEFQYPTNTLNAVVPLYSFSFSDKISGSIKGILGKGVADASKIDDKINTNLGWALDFDYFSEETLFNPFLGISQMWIDPETTKNGGAMYMFAGNRFFVYRRSISLDIKGGLAYWRGFGEKSLSDYFLSGAVAYHRDVNYTWAGSPLFSGLETSLLYSPIYQTMTGKFTLPIRLFNEMSFGINVMLGTDARTMTNDKAIENQPVQMGAYKPEYGSIYGFGLDIRLFGDVLYPFPAINPYISLQRNFVEEERGKSSGAGSMIYFGGRFQIKGSLSAEIFTGPAFWSDPWIKSYLTEATISKPKSWNIGFGVTYQVGMIKPKIKKLVGQAYIYNDEKMNDAITYPTEENIYPLESEIVARELYETRVYSLEREPDIVYGDVTDIKFIKENMGFIMDPKNLTLNNFPINMVPDSAGDILLIALFDKQKTYVNNIKPENMRIHFVDLKNSRYFGYRWDRNRTLQPEVREFEELNLNDTSKPIYYGSYHEYVDSLRWLNKSKVFGIMDGDFLEKLILQKLESANTGYDTTNLTSDPTFWSRKEFCQKNYQLAFISMKRKSLEKIKDVCTDWGVCIQFNKDANKNNRVFISKKELPDVKIASLPEVEIAGSAIVALDSGDVFFYSNIVKVRELPEDNENESTIKPDEKLSSSTTDSAAFIIELNNFELGNANLNEGIKNYLKAELEKLTFLNASYQLININGYTDATPLVENSKYKSNDELSLDRAQKVKEALVKLGIPSNKVKLIKGLGIRNKDKMY